MIDNFKINSLYNFFGSVIPAVLGLVAIIFLRGSLSYQEFITLSFFWTLITVVTVSDLGMSRLASRESAALRLKQIDLTQFILRFKELIFTTFIISIFVSIFLYFLIHYLLSANVDKNDLSLILISIPFYLVSFIFRGFLEGENSFFTVNIIKVFSSLIAFGTPIFQFVIFGQINYLWITYILIISRVIISLYVIVSKFSVFSVFFNSNLYKYTSQKYFLESPMLAFGGILGAVYIFFERSMFESYFPYFYSDFFIAHQLILGLWIIPSSLSLAIYPTLANTKLLSTTKFISKTLPYIFTISIVFFSVVYLFLIFFEEEMNFNQIENDYFLPSVYLYLMFGAVTSAVAQVINVSLLSARDYKFIFFYQSIVFVIYFFIQNIYGISNYLLFLFFWNVRYMIDLVIIFLRSYFLALKSRRNI
jgi:O-antigen/teichoic acid export membrane protein